VVGGEGLSRFDEGFFDKEGFLNSPSFSLSFPFSALTLLFTALSSTVFSPDSLDLRDPSILSDLSGSFSFPTPERTGVSNPNEPKKSATDFEGGSETRGMFEVSGLSIAAFYTSHHTTTSVSMTRTTKMKERRGGGHTVNFDEEVLFSFLAAKACFVFSNSLAISTGSSSLEGSHERNVSWPR